MISAKYRKDYTGEFVITNTAWSGGKKRSQREWIPNPIENHHISGRAACIASAADQVHFDFRILERHKGGLLGRLKLQTYGTTAVAKHMRLDFAVEKDEQALQEILNAHYYKQNVIYTTPRLCLKHPGAFYLIPFNPPFVSEVVLPYLAAFDGHKEVFLLGYTEEARIPHKDWQQQMEQVFAAFSGTQFVHVAHAPQTPAAWKNYSNFRQFTHREFITYCDV